MSSATKRKKTKVTAKKPAKDEDGLRDGTESETARVAGTIYCLLMVEPNYRNGGTRSMMTLFHTEYDALKAKWIWVTRWAEGCDVDEDAPKCKFSTWTHEATYGDDYIYCTIEKADMNNVRDGNSFYFTSLNC